MRLRMACYDGFESKLLSVALMGVTRFQARNHPQQVLLSGVDVSVDERATPQEYFDLLHRRFRFTVDAAALPYNAKLERYWSPEDDGLAQDWRGERVWCNPPFSDIEPWVVKARDGGAELAVLLVPASRTDLDWWHDHVEPERDRGGRLRVEFLRGRLRFGMGRMAPLPHSRPPFGCCLLIWEASKSPGGGSSNEGPDDDRGGAS